MPFWSGAMVAWRELFLTSCHVLSTTIGIGQNGRFEISAIFVGHLQYSWKVGIQISGNHWIRSTQACRQRSSRSALLGNPKIIIWTSHDISAWQSLNVFKIRVLKFWCQFLSHKQHISFNLCTPQELAKETQKAWKRKEQNAPKLSKSWKTQNSTKQLGVWIVQGI